MIAKFPNFTHITLSDREKINEFVKSYPAYSDFNFVSLYSWNVDNSMTACWLNGNLVIRMPDYTSGKDILTFIGDKKVTSTIKTLLDYAEKELGESRLKLIPHTTAKQAKEMKSLSDLSIRQDRNNFDYICSTHKIKNLKGPDVSNVRTSINRFQREDFSKVDVRELPHSSQLANTLLNLFDTWAQQHTERKNDSQSSKDHERMALERAARHVKKLDIYALGLYIDKKLVGFTIAEDLHNNMGMIHFQKVISPYKGAADYLTYETASFLHRQNCSYMNYQQDLGVPGLRRWKKKWALTSFLKKYLIERR